MTSALKRPIEAEVVPPPAQPQEESYTKSLSINDVLRHQDKLVRLIAAIPSANLAYVIDIESKLALPHQVLYQDLKEHGIPEADIAWRRPLNSSAACQEVREVRFNRIQGLVKDPSILSAYTRGPLLQIHANKVGVSKKTLLADLRAWWQRGQLKDALMGDYFRSGRITESTTGALVLDGKSTDGKQQVVLAPCRDNARGRRPIDGNYTPMKLTAQEKLRIIKLGKEKYSADQTVSIRSVVAHVLVRLYAVRDTNGKLKLDEHDAPIFPPLGRRPTNRQISYLLQTALSIPKTYARRHGTAEYLNNMAPTTGTVLDDCNGPGDVYEADETTLDYHIVSALDMTITLGKPVLHIVVDRYSRLIVGFHVSLDAANWEDGKLAFLSVANDWEALCKQHGVKYVPADFPAQGVMCNRLFGDRGLLMTFASDSLSIIGNDTTNAPALLSRSKPIVESTFRRFNKLLKELPGYEPQWNVNKRRAKPYEKDACLTLSQLEGVLLRAMICLNREILENYPQRATDTKAGLLPVPRELWVRESERLNALPRRVSREWLQRSLLSTNTAKVTQDGIAFQGNYYTCKEAIKNDWFSIASIDSPFDVNVRFTPKNLDEILVEDPKNPALQYLAKLTTRSQRIVGEEAGLSDTQAEANAAGNRRIRRQAETTNETLRAGFIAGTSAVVQTAQTAVQAAVKGKSSASRKNNAPDAREVESAEGRKAAHHLGLKEPQQETATADAVDPVPTKEPPPSGAPNNSTDPGLMAEFMNALEQP